MRCLRGCVGVDVLSLGAPGRAAEAVLWAGLRHRLQPRGWRQGHVCLGGCRRLGEDVRPPAPGAQHHHLRGPSAPPPAAPVLEQAGSQLPGHDGHGRDGGCDSRCQSSLHPRCQVKQPQSMCKWNCLGTSLLLPHLYSS